MRIASLLPNVPLLQFQALELREGRLQMALKVKAKYGVCPDCQQKSKGVHSSYHRDIGDLPWAGIPMGIEVKVRKFFCRNAECPRAIFSERLGGEVEPYARRTKRFNEQLTGLGLASGGNAGARLAKALGMPASASTILRIIHRLPDTPEYEQPRVVGIDDWAFRKGQDYGTILVDLEKGKAIDLSPDRETETVKQWLLAHPGIEVISRDRADAYAAAASAGAPGAVQVADRWHLLKNLSDALKRMLDKHNKELRTAAIELAKSKNLSLVQEPKHEEPVESAKPGPEPGPEKPMSKYELNFWEVKRLQAENYSIRSIARQAGLHRETVKKYLHYEEYPKRAVPAPAPSSALAYEAYLTKRWEEGERNRKQLWKEAAGQGFGGSLQSVCRLIRKFPDYEQTKNPPTPLEVRVWAARKASFLLTKKKKKLEEDERVFLEALYQACPLAKKAAKLSRQFKRMSNKRQGEKLDGWIEKAKSSGIAALKNFAAGLEQDYDAAKAALSLDWSNGQVEGQVNRLKNIKRQMYGRASFRLLKKRVLADTG